MSTLSIEFSLFTKECNERGYYRVKNQQKDNLYAMWTKNGIKAEIKKKSNSLVYVIGFGRNAEELELLAEEVASKGFIISSTKNKIICLTVSNPSDPMPDFWVLINMLEDIDGIVAKSRGISIKVFTKEVDETNKFEKIAGRYFYAIENEDQELLDLARNLLSGDSIDHIIGRGESVDHTPEDSYREHIVPCILIHNEAIRMVLEGSTKVEVAQMIASNLAIVRITNDQADLLDNTKRMNLKTTMPEGWKFGDTVFARLIAADIKLK